MTAECTVLLYQRTLSLLTVAFKLLTVNVFCYSLLTDHLLVEQICSFSWSIFTGVFQNYIGPRHAVTQLSLFLFTFKMVQNFAESPSSIWNSCRHFFSLWFFFPGKIIRLRSEMLNRQLSTTPVPSFVLIQLKQFWTHVQVHSFGVTPFIRYISSSLSQSPWCLSLREVQYSKPTFLIHVRVQASPGKEFPMSQIRK